MRNMYSYVIKSPGVEQGGARRPGGLDRSTPFKSLNNLFRQ